MNKKGYTKILLIDLKKAFDLIDHNSLREAIEKKIDNPNLKQVLKNI